MSELVTDYLEGALPLRTRVPARLHLFACPSCRSYFRQMRQTVHLVRSGVPRQPAEAVEEALLARLAELRRRDPPGG